jgi:uncharacterized membrane protein YjgN (DUF898 family)
MHAPAPASLTNPPIAYTGRIGALYKLFIVNLLLTIVTLGVFRFWARTRLRRYIWANTTVGGEAFEYTGTGGELFKGFLLAIAIFLPAVIVLGVAQVFLPPLLSVIITFAFYFGIFFLALAGGFAARRYQMRRTTWRGIRFTVDGSPWAFAVAMLWRVLLLPFTLFLMLPWVAAANLRRTLGQTRFGSLPASFVGTGGGLFPWMVLAVGVFFAALVPGLIAAGGAIYAAIRMMMGNQGGQFDPSMAGTLIFGIIALYGTLFLAFALAGAVYRAATMQFTFDNLRLDATRFGFAPAIGRTVLFLIGNTLLVLVTLGLGFPWALHRRLQYIAAGITATGSIDLAAVAQAEAGPRRGEGLADVLGLEAGPF